MHDKGFYRPSTKPQWANKRPFEEIEPIEPFQNYENSQGSTGGYFIRSTPDMSHMIIYFRRSHL